MHNTTDTNQSLPPAAEAATVKPERGFATGELVVLRPVQEADLPQLAQLLAENPYDRESRPWTLQYLKQKFEDKERPGLWEETKSRYFAIARKQGGVVGFLFEEDSWSLHNMWWNRFHLGLELADRAALGCDALNAYFAYKQRWHDPLRISFSIASVESEKAQWLSDAGYTQEVQLPDAVLYRGEPVSEVLYSWFSPRLLERHSPDGPVAGEDDAAEIVMAEGAVRRQPGVKE